MLYFFVYILTCKILKVEILRLTEKRANYFISVCIDNFTLIVNKCRTSGIIHF